MSKDNPWKKLDSRIVYENPWIRVREDSVVHPDGSDGIYGVVETRKATGVVALTPENEVYLVGQYRYTMEEYSWEIIEGGAEDAETPLEGAQRELQEEAGLLANSWQQLGEEVHLSNCHSSERAYIFLAQSLQETTTNPDHTEVLALRKLPLIEALRLIDSGEIKDAVSVIGLQRAASYLQQSLEQNLEQNKN